MVDETMGRLEHLSVDELEKLSSRQLQLLKMQRQQSLSKEERLKNLMNQFHRHEQKLDSLRHIRSSLQTQETRLHDLRQLKSQLDRQTTLKDQLSEELERTKAMFSVREKELAEAVAKVDILTQQLERTRTQKSTALLPANAGEEIERLKQEQRLRAQALQQHKRKMEEKENGLLRRTLQRNELDQRIHDITERIHSNQRQKRRVASHVPVKVVKENGVGPGGTAAQAGHAQTEEVKKRYGSHDDGLRSESAPTVREAIQAKVKAALATDKEPKRKDEKKTIKSREESVSDDSAVWLSEQDKNRVNEKEPSSGVDGSVWSKYRDPTKRPVELSHSHLPSLVTDTFLLVSNPAVTDRDRESSPRSNSTGTPEPSSSASTSESAALPPPPPAPLHQRASPLSLPATGNGTGGTPPLTVGHHRHRSRDVLEKPPVVEKEEGVEVRGKAGGGRRVKSDPQALLLDASLEGELELVIKTCQQVLDVSASNDEGITALHNAICAGHLQIVKFLVEFGCDVNAQDSDGWSPLHCAASCNNLAMCQFLVLHGACIFARTTSDQEAPADKCEQDEADYEGCSQYLFHTMASLGKAGGGIVYAVYSYQSQNADELSFKCGDKLRVLRAGDDEESEWYWAEKVLPSPSKSPSETGYIPRNLLSLHPRVQRSPPAS